MRVVAVVLAVALACVGCRGESPSSGGGIDDIETTLNSVEADLDQP
ncbi:hypothetical protein [Lentzea tibetensis]|nr:hypothetical protein [Lentzea tibetensis]